MRAKDVMSANVVTVGPEADVRAVARLLVEHGISGVPVVEQGGRLVGIVSEGDLMRRAEAGTERRSSWWLELLAGPEETARRYVKSHGRTARDVMTREVVTVAEDASLEQIATLLERHRIKRVPVIRDGRIVGIVSRANLLHGLVAKEAAARVTPDDAAIREQVIAGIREAGITEPYVNVVVAGGVVHIWGLVDSEKQRQAVRVAAEAVPGISAIENNVGVLSSPLLRGSWT